VSKRVYTDEEKAKVLVALEANEGIVKRTARETGVAEQTIRDWKKQAERGALTAGVQDALPAAASEFATKTERVRDLMLDQLEAKVINDDLNGRDLITGIGVLTDKLRITRGEATSRTETVQESSTPQEIGESIYGFLSRAFAAGEQRDLDIVLSDEDISDADWEQAALAELPAGS
jgi:transposase-like protein